MSDSSFDPHELMNESRSIMERLDIFIEEVKKLGYNSRAIREGTLNEHVLSYAFVVPPQMIRTYFGLFLCEDEEKQLISEKKLDTGFVRTLMLIEPDIREAIYKQLNEILKEEYPVASLIEFIDNGSWRIRIRDVYEAVHKDYWAAASSYLKDTNTYDVVINKWFRSMLMSIKRYNASDKQLAWLELGIIHDSELELGVFTAEILRKEYPEAVEEIEKYLGDYMHFGLS